MQNMDIPGHKLQKFASGFSPSHATILWLSFTNIKHLERIMSNGRHRKVGFPRDRTTNLSRPHDCPGKVHNRDLLLRTNNSNKAWIICGFAVRRNVFHPSVRAFQIDSGRGAFATAASDVRSWRKYLALICLSSSGAHFHSRHGTCRTFTSALGAINAWSPEYDAFGRKMKNNCLPARGRFGRFKWHRISFVFIPGGVPAVWAVLSYHWKFFFTISDSRLGFMITSNSVLILNRRLLYRILRASRKIEQLPLFGSINPWTKNRCKLSWQSCVFSCYLCSIKSKHTSCALSGKSRYPKYLPNVYTQSEHYYLI